MEISPNDQIAIAYFLEEADGKAYHWVAFDFSNDKQFNYLRGFESASEAIEFCAAANIRFDYAEQNFMEANYQYMPMDSFLDATLPGRILAIPSASPDQLLAQLTAQNVQVLQSLGAETLMPLIQLGAVFPAQFDQEIFPAEEIDRFIVVAHHHAGHQVYEIGHSVKIVDSFDSLDVAEKYFGGLIRQYHDNTDRNDYQLIGLYRDQEYKFNLEATPERYSGVTLKTAYYQYDVDLKAKVWQVENNLNLDRPVIIQHFIYAQYDVEKEQFKILNDRLQETRLEDIKTSTYPSYFINEKFTFKNLSIMNEQSYEYVQNQLFYMGFGNELNQPLRDKMDQNLAEFTLEFSKDFGKDSTKNVLHFSKGDDLQKDMTFFNRLEMTLKKEGREDLTQTFFVGKNYNYTLQERYNMLDGRAVYREQPKMEPVEENGQVKMKPTGETYFAWKRLDFKEADTYGNFVPKIMFWNHERELTKYPIKNIEEKYDRSRLLPALQRGDRVSVTLVRDGVETPVKLVANPRMTRLDFYDANGQSMMVRPVEKQAVSQSEAAEMTPQQVQQAAIAKAAEQKQQTEQTTGANITQETGPQQSQQNEAKKEGAAEEQKADKVERKAHRVHI